MDATGRAGGVGKEDTVEAPRFNDPVLRLSSEPASDGVSIWNFILLVDDATVLLSSNYNIHKQIHHVSKNECRIQYVYIRWFQSIQVFPPIKLLIQLSLTVDAL